MSSPDLAANPDNYCYRHPKRQSFVLCQRCARTVCSECRTQAAVGVICPECMKEQRKNRTPGQKKAQRRWRGAGAIAVADGRVRSLPWVVGVMVVVYLFQLLSMAIPALTVQEWFLFYPPYLYPEFGFGFQPWRVFTGAFVHGGFIHLALNLLALWLMGRALEPLLGTWRFLVLFFLSAIGGAAAVTLLSFTTPVVGASGAVFGLFGAYLVIARKLGGNITGILIVLGINLALGFVPGFNISWQAHVGGLVAGLSLGLIFATTSRLKAMQFVLLGVLALALLALFAVPPLTGFPALR